MLLRFTVLLMIAVPLSSIAPPAAASPPTWAMPLLSDALAAHQSGRFTQAAHNFRRLAGQGSAVAETMLGVMASRGQGMARDPATAATWWLRAARRGYPPAQLALARACAEGSGIARDRGSAWVWARLAANRGDAPTAAKATALATRLAREFDAPTLTLLDQRLQQWRPWATLE
ncbi:tetratricopeptide repeat protein [Glacieibacterium sp.]|uniref:tetratricopeptide repeat protein n=1 Tax=Glacieibacterium sp. TaxID=2860237 RepID=UPI003B0051CC